MEAPEVDEQDGREPGRFYRPGTAAPAVFRLEWRPPMPGRPARERSPRYRIMEQIEYVDDLRRWHRFPLDVDHNETDLASIPFFVTWLVPKDGAHTPAALLHDTLIGGTVGVDYDTSDGEQISERHADYLFREAMRNSSVGVVRRWLMWSAVSMKTLCVRRGGGSFWKKARWGRILPISAAFIVALALAFVMALDVPDFINSEKTFDDKALLSWLSWFDVFGERPWWSEILRGVGAIAVCAALCAVVVALVTRSTQGLWAGGVVGVAIGFLGLPAVASLVGFSIYWAFEQAARWIGRS
jgi:hypothetical protein